VTWTAPGGSVSVASGPSTVWTAPNIPGTYPITATSNANPAFRAFSTIQVAGVIGCDPTQLAPLFIGGWTIAAWGPAFGVVVGSCFGGDFFPYLDNGGVFNISGSLGSTVGTFQPPPTFLSYMGNFSCGADGSFRFASNANEFEFFIRLGAPEDPTNTNVVSGTIAF